jgi:hypothetical protein
MVDKFRGISIALKDMGLEDFFAIEERLMADELLRRTMADYHDLVEDGRREIYRIER